MTLSNVDLENFDDGNASTPRLSADYKRGYADALEAAEKNEAAQLSDLVKSISTTLADMTFGYTEARLLLMDRIRPLLAQVAETVLPEVTRQNFAAHLVETLVDDFQSVIDQPIDIAIHPDALDHVAEAVSPSLGAFTFVADPLLTEGQARLRNADTHILIDLPALLEALQTALNGLEPLERTQSHG